MPNLFIDSIDQEAWDEWGLIDVYPHSAHGFTAKAVVEATNPNDKSTPGWLIFTADGDTPAEAVARVERGIIETLAQGGELVEHRVGLPDRRGNWGRRREDDYRNEERLTALVNP